MSFELINSDSQSPYIVVCEHASNRLPDGYGTLGLVPEYLNHHFAIDVGAVDVSKARADKLDATCILGTYSRLLVDINRPINHPTLMLEQADGIDVPGNQNLSHEERQKRIDTYYTPFHCALSDMVSARVTKGHVPFCINIHSFTPVFLEAKRHWDIGFLWAQDGRALPAVTAYFEGKGFCVGNNEPYDARKLGGTTVNRHFDSKRLPSLLVEIRHDLINTSEKAGVWAEHLCNALKHLTDEHFTLFEGDLAEFEDETSLNYFRDLVRSIQSG